MKQIFSLLLALNLGLFLWGYGQERRSETKSGPRADIGVLPLLSELKNGSASELAITGGSGREASQPLLNDAAAGDESASFEAEQWAEEEKTELLIVMPPPITKEEQAVANLSTPPPKEHPDDTPIQDEVNGLADKDLLQEALSEIETEEVQPVIADSTRIEFPPLNESEVKETLKKPPKPEPEIENKPEVNALDNGTHAGIAVDPAETVLEKACYRFGPIDKRPSAEKLTEQLARLGTEATVQEVTAKQHIGYWVIYLPQGDAEMIQKKMLELKAAGITDIWRFPQGEYSNAISLGLFSRMENAERVKKRALAKGFITEVLSRYEESIQYWLEFYSSDKPPLSEDTLWVMQDSYSASEIEIHPCLTVVIP